MTDSRFESCILLIRQGSSEGLREIYEGYFKTIYSVMLSVVNNRANAEDLTSDFFLKLWERLADTYRAGNGHKTWLVTIARNMAADFLRRSSRVELTIDAPADESASRSEPVSGENLEAAVIGNLTVSEALKTLEEGEREIVNLRLFADFTFKEIARALSMPLGTVTWKYRGAIKKLSNYVKEVQKQ